MSFTFLAMFSDPVIEKPYIIHSTGVLFKMRYHGKWRSLSATGSASLAFLVVFMWQEDLRLLTLCPGRISLLSC
jgi:hypothetical protein